MRLKLGARGLDRAASRREPDPFLVLFASRGGVWELVWSTAPSRKTTDPVFNGAPVCLRPLSSDVVKSLEC